ncbi:GrlR family regulatory protein [Pelagibius sp.]|uniref:GrlR family regulatory protein n=1 Tax=Pelagibius sp. TaxID=1931238 RepID=UPI003460393D
MLSGLFGVDFQASNRDFGSGIVVIDNGRVNGGDGSYFYQGRFDNYGGKVRATIEVTHYRGTPNSVMGPISRFTLNLSGTSDDSGFDLQGSSQSIPNVSIKMRGRRVAPLFE